MIENTVNSSGNPSPNDTLYLNTGGSSTSNGSGDLTEKARNAVLNGDTVIIQWKPSVKNKIVLTTGVI